MNMRNKKIHYPCQQKHSRVLGKSALATEKQSIWSEWMERLHKWKLFFMKNNIFPLRELDRGYLAIAGSISPLITTVFLGHQKEEDKLLQGSTLIIMLVCIASAWHEEKHAYRFHHILKILPHPTWYQTLFRTIIWSLYTSTMYMIVFN